MKNKALILGIPLFVSLFFGSCTLGRLGFGVVLWSEDDSVVTNGTLVPILDESRIQKAYKIEIPSSGKLTLIPTGRVMFFENEAEARQFHSDFTPWAFTWAFVGRAGLPMRALPNSTSTGMYKFHNNQQLKVISRTPTKEKVGNLEGFWYKVLTDDGFQGWVFDYYLTITEATDSGQVENVAQKVADPYLDDLLSKNWRPESFQEMITSGQIRLEDFNDDYGLKILPDENSVVVTTSKHKTVFNYSEIVKIDQSSYLFQDTSLRIRFGGSSRITATYTYKNTQWTQTFVELETDVTELITQEIIRRGEAYQKLLDQGPLLSSPSFGDLLFLSNQTFEWSGYQRLVPTLLSEGFSGKGRVTFSLFLSPELGQRYTGALNLHFKKDTQEISIPFLYHFTGNGVQFVPADERSIEGGIVKAESSQPLSIFFTLSKP